MCLVFLTLGKLSTIPGVQDDQCRLPYQLGQAVGGTTTQPGSSPCPQCLELLPERHLLSSFSHSGVPPSLTRARKEEIIHFGGRAASIAWRPCPRATRRDASMGDVTQLLSPRCAPLTCFAPEKRNTLAPSQRGLWDFSLVGSGSTLCAC